MTIPPTPVPGSTPTSVVAGTARTLDLAGALPTGTVVLDASAGTGKTYAIAALVTRVVAEGRCTLPQLLVTTFTRAATAELRDRVRRRLVGAGRHLRAVAAGRPPDTDDVVLRHLAEADGPELDARIARLSLALTHFDGATISTIHGFTQQVLRSVGLSADVPRDVELDEDGRALVTEVADDVYLRRYLTTDGQQPPGHDLTVRIARAVADNRDAALHPGRTDGSGDGFEHAALAHDLRDELAARKRAATTLSYDDLLLALRDALTDPATGDLAVSVLRQRYRWALVDEFQDTDPVQWAILDRAFRDDTDPDRTLVLIGDPKQAIYRFRGADVRTYLEATARADHRFQLTTNHRSDGPLLGALDRLFTGTVFGGDDIVFTPVAATPAHADAAVHDDRDAAAVQLRPYVPTDAPGATALRRRIALDVTGVIADQVGRVRIGRGRDERALRPGDVAVLVRTNVEARLVQRCLREAGIASVVNGVGSVLATEAAEDWKVLLDALEAPSDPRRIRRLALTRWVGWDAQRLAAATDDDLEGLHTAAHRWAQVGTAHGVATLLRTILVERRVAPRLLRELGGERHLTDLRHLGELLHAAEREHDRGLGSLRTWLRTAQREAGDEPNPPEVQARRLETDADAVQILTIHRSKGLEYPVVLVPFSWSAGQAPRAPLVVHDPDTRGRIVDVGPSERPGYEVAREIAKRDDDGEALRLLYVALTRARHRAVVWWTPGGQGTAALTRVLFGRDATGRVVPGADATPPTTADEVVGRLRSWLPGPTLSVTAMDPPAAAGGSTDRAADPAADPAATTRAGEPDTVEAAGSGSGELRVARFDRWLDLSWRRTSYSGILRRAERDEAYHGTATRVASEPEVVSTDDEPDTDDELGTDGAGAPRAGTTGVIAPGAADLGAAVDGPDDPGGGLPLGGLRGGAAFGTLVHAVLEHVDFAAADLSGALDVVIGHQAKRHRVPTLEPTDLPVLRDGLVAAVTSPLGPLAGRVATSDGPRWRRLADVARTDRLDEVTFELPLRGGDHGRTGVGAGTRELDGPPGLPGPLDLSGPLSRLADLLERPAVAGGLADDDPLRACDYPDRLRRPGLGHDLRGYLNGSIDLVLRVHDGDVPRHLVVDHKTNRIGGAAARIGDFHPDGLVAEMVHHDYPLQALLYLVALHRYLRWRQPAYDPDVHLGGVLYLFLRGMVGPDTPTVDGAPYGVFAWSPPAAVVTDLSDLLDGGGSPATDGRRAGHLRGGSR